jgi:hypothetical protein
MRQGLREGDRIATEEGVGLEEGLADVPLVTKRSVPQEPTEFSKRLSPITCGLICLASFPSLPAPLLGLPGNISQINHLSLNLPSRVSFWENPT